MLSNVLFAYLDLGFVHGVFRDCDEQRLVERSGSALSVSVSVSLLYLSHFPQSLFSLRWSNVQVVLAWALQQGISVVPRSARPEHIRDNAR